MESVQEEKCPYCIQSVPVTNYDLHILRCKGKQSKVQEIQKEEEFQELSPIQLKQNESLLLCQYCGEQLSIVDIVDHCQIYHSQFMDPENAAQNNNPEEMNEILIAQEIESQFMENEERKQEIPKKK